MLEVLLRHRQLLKVRHESPQRPAVEVERLPIVRPSLGSAPAAADPTPYDMPPVPPGYTPGVCHHPVHVVFERIRYGVTPIGYDTPLSTAALLPCHHRNPAGC